MKMNFFERHAIRTNEGKIEVFAVKQLIIEPLEIIAFCLDKNALESLKQSLIIFYRNSSLEGKEPIFTSKFDEKTKAVTFLTSAN